MKSYGACHAAGCTRRDCESASVVAAGMCLSTADRIAASHLVRRRVGVEVDPPLEELLEPLAQAVLERALEPLRVLVGRGAVQCSTKTHSRWVSFGIVEVGGFHLPGLLDGDFAPGDERGRGEDGIVARFPGVTARLARNCAGAVHRPRPNYMSLRTHAAQQTCPSVWGPGEIGHHTHYA
eukprot:2361864-Prymnesium_polylepis.1